MIYLGILAVLIIAGTLIYLKFYRKSESASADTHAKWDKNKQ